MLARTMNPAAMLTELMDSMEMQSEEWIYRYDRRTGQVAMVEDDGERFLELPDAFDFHEYRQMERFIGTVEDSNVADALWRAIKGKGAFRCFKDTAARHGLLDAWYRFRDERAKDFVIRSAEFNQVPYEDDTAKRRT